jgi:HD-GYP domain-containing protein (c-di-GMP phosphodiesterase class II)
MPRDTKTILRGLLRQEVVSRHLTSLKEHHLETYQHSLRVGSLCLDIGVLLDLAPNELELLGLSGLLHDIGKRRITDDILSKRTPLDAKEKEAMSRHPRLGFLELGEEGNEVVRRVVVTHHEYKLDPYPRKGQERRQDERVEGRRMSGELSDTFGQIVAVADIYDALASRRSYKPPLSEVNVEAELRRQFTGDSRYIDLVLQVQGHYRSVGTVPAGDDGLHG